MKKELKVGILGAGFMGHTHAKNLIKIDGVTITAVCAATKEKADNLCTNILDGKATAYDCFDSMIENENLDVIFICIPPFAHNGQVEMAAEKGINLFVEKPIALDTIRGKSMVEAIKKAGVKSQVGYHMRFGYAVQELKKLIESGEAGIPTLFNGRYECNALHAPWWREKDKSGGQILEQIIHTYDMAMYLLGEPEFASGFTSNLCHKEVPQYTVEDTSVSTIKFKSGALANISGSNCAVIWEWNNPFTVVCQNVTAYFTNPNKAEFVILNGETSERRIVEGYSDMYFEETKAFIEAVRGDAPNLCTIEEGYYSLKLVEAVKNSSTNNGTIVKII